MNCNAGDGKSILLVDDDRGVADVCVQMLTHHGYKVTSSVTGEDAIDVFSTDHFDLVILDVGLPGINGLDCAQELRRRRRDVKIVISSGDCAGLNKDIPVTSRSFHVLQKPYTMNELICTVSNIMGGDFSIRSASL